MPIFHEIRFRDDELEPGGLKLLGVKESPLGQDATRVPFSTPATMFLPKSGYFPTARAAATLEHFFQQLREVLSDDCPLLSEGSANLRVP